MAPHYPSPNTTDTVVRLRPRTDAPRQPLPQEPAQVVQLHAVHAVVPPAAHDVARATAQDVKWRLHAALQRLQRPHGNYGNLQLQEAAALAAAYTDAVHRHLWAVLEGATPPNAAQQSFAAQQSDAELLEVLRMRRPTPAYHPGYVAAIVHEARQRAQQLQAMLDSAGIAHDERQEQQELHLRYGQAMHSVRTLLYSHRGAAAPSPSLLRVMRCWGHEKLLHEAEEPSDTSLAYLLGLITVLQEKAPTPSKER